MDRRPGDTPLGLLTVDFVLTSGRFAYPSEQAAYEVPLPRIILDRAFED